MIHKSVTFYFSLKLLRFSVEFNVLSETGINILQITKEIQTVSLHPNYLVMLKTTKKQPTDFCSVSYSVKPGLV